MRVFLAALLLLLAGCAVPDGGVSPVNDESVSHRATVAYSELAAEAYETVAGQIDAGVITSDKDAHAQLSQLLKDAGKSAFRPVDELLQAEIGETWDARRAAQVFRTLAAGHRRVK